jgi:hypothetical protein
MSIHVISAVLNCRDKQLTSSRRMVLVCLANYAGEDGRSWPSQKLIADESGCGIRSVKDHIKWLDDNGFISRTTKKLGQGNGSRTNYRISLQRLSEGTKDRGAEFAGANNARAKSVPCEGSIPPLTNRQEPSISNSNELDLRDTPPEQPKRKAAPRGAARKCQIPTSWAPDPTSYAYGSKRGLTPEEMNHEADQFRNDAVAKQKRFIDWHAAFRTWLGNSAKWKAERAARSNNRPNTAGQPRRGGLVAAGLRDISESRGYGEPVSEERGLGAGYVIDREAS